MSARVRMALYGLSSLIVATVLTTEIAAQTFSVSGTVGAVYLHPTAMPGMRQGNDPSQDWDMGPNVWWRHNWPAFESAKAGDLAQLKHLFADHPRILLLLYFPLYLADTIHGTVYLQRLESVIEHFGANGVEVMLFFGRPELRGQGTWQDAHDPVDDQKARAYILANIDRVLRFGTIPVRVKSATVYYMGRSSFCPKNEAAILDFNRTLKATINRAGAAYFQHVDGPFWEFQTGGPAGSWNQCGYTPESIAPSSGSSDGLAAESWVQGSLRPGVARLISEGRFTPEQILLIKNVPNCDDPVVMAAGYRCATGSLPIDNSTWFEWIHELGLTAWSVWTFADGGLADINPYGNVSNDGSSLTSKGAFDRAAAMAWNLTDDPVSATVTTIRAVHIVQLRSAVNAFRRAAGLSEFPFADNDLSVGTQVRAIHVLELRTALQQARAKSGLPALTFTDSSLIGTTVKAAHLQEIRHGLK